MTYDFKNELQYLELWRDDGGGYMPIGIRNRGRIHVESLEHHCIWLDSRSYWWNHMELYFKPDITNSISSLLKGY